MTKQEIIQVAEIVQVVVRKELQSKNNKLMEEIKALKSELKQMKTLLNEAGIQRTPLSNLVLEPNGTGTIPAGPTITTPTPPTPKTGVTKTASVLHGVLGGLMDDITPFDGSEEEDASIADVVFDPSAVEQFESAGNAAAANVLKTLQTTDFRKKLAIMERASNYRPGM